MKTSKRQLLHLSVLALVAACGPSASAVDAFVTDTPCQAGEVRCLGQSYQTCQNGFFVEAENCPGFERCVAELGCVDCDPNIATTCVGDDVYTCESDGTVGRYQESCDIEQCSNGTCEGSCVSSSQLIYVVDLEFRLWSFDPRELPGDPYSLIGPLSCPAGPPLGGGFPPSTPFSMSVDREGRAWVLYSSGEIFWVDTETAACQPSGFQVGQQGFELFGMGFVTEGNSDQEALFIAGGGANEINGNARLAFIDKATLAVQPVGQFSTNGIWGPELTGRGDGALFAYFPDPVGATVAQVDKTNSALIQEWSVPGLGENLRAWAFAHWGGQYYIFVTTEQLFGNPTANVLRLDPVTGVTEQILTNTGKTVVGAGVSTCAPLVID